MSASSQPSLSRVLRFFSKSKLSKILIVCTYHNVLFIRYVENIMIILCVLFFSSQMPLFHISRKFFCLQAKLMIMIPFNLLDLTHYTHIHTRYTAVPLIKRYIVLGFISCQH
jgi:hypothetical protein